ncbi:helix-turn-helix transcriptional regulator [Terrimonas alba]|uniref:helix-turn-helix transcriptional regulator n=1 Tax=Terrimonas alba TaxID=3349636 RepID=UPI0035F477BF
MYIGKAVDTSIHDHHAVQITISFDEAIEINLPDSSFKFKAAIIDSDQPHECRTYDNTFLLLNIAPETKIGIALKKIYLANQKIAELSAEKASEFIGKLKNELKGTQHSNEIFSITQQFLHALSYTEETRIFDDRILDVLKLLNQQNDVPIKINDLASKVFISPNRLIHLFTDQVGIPIRKYILWRKLLIALQEMITTKNITQAALEGGFSDAPHFNRTFKRMFGLNPSTLLKNSQIIQAYRK